MKLRAGVALFAIVLSLVSCKRSAPVGTRAATSPLASTASTAAPAVAASMAAKGETRLRMLLEGSARADELPLAHTDPDVPYAPGQYRELTTVVDDSPTPNTDVSATAAAVVDPARPIDGALDDENLQRVTRGMRAGFRNCYRRALLSERGLSGKMTLEFTVGPSGAVQAVHGGLSAEQELRAQGLRSCSRARGGLQSPRCGRHGALPTGCHVHERN